MCVSQHERNELVMFAIGDRICYPMHGVGTVQSIEERTVLNETTSYYTLKFVSNNLTAMVPVDMAEKVGLRPIITPKECEEVLNYMIESPIKESDNWNQRYRENLDKLRKGGIYDVADVVVCLKKRNEEKGLSSGERKMFSLAKQVLVTELAIATNRDINEFSDVI